MPGLSKDIRARTIVRVPCDEFPPREDVLQTREDMIEAMGQRAIQIAEERALTKSLTQLHTAVRIDGEPGEDEYVTFRVTRSRPRSRPRPNYSQYKLVNIDSLPNGQGGFEVNDAHDTGQIVTLPDNPNRGAVTKALKELGRLKRELDPSRMYIKTEDSGSVGLYHKNGRMLYELNPLTSPASQPPAE